MIHLPGRVHSCVCHSLMSCVWGITLYVHSCVCHSLTPGSLPQNESIFPDKWHHWDHWSTTPSSCRISVIIASIIPLNSPGSGFNFPLYQTVQVHARCNHPQKSALQSLYKEKCSNSWQFSHVQILHIQLATKFVMLNDYRVDFAEFHLCAFLRGARRSRPSPNRRPRAPVVSSLCCVCVCVCVCCACIALHTAGHHVPTEYRAVLQRCGALFRRCRALLWKAVALPHKTARQVYVHIYTYIYICAYMYTYSYMYIYIRMQIVAHTHLLYRHYVYVHTYK